MLNHRELAVWKMAFALADEVLELAETEPLARRFYFRDQMCDAAMSVPANIAEGNGRSTPLDYASFLDRARGSPFELDTWLLAGARRKYVDPAIQIRLEAEMTDSVECCFSMARSLRRKPALESRGG